LLTHFRRWPCRYRHPSCDGLSLSWPGIEGRDRALSSYREKISHRRKGAGFSASAIPALLVEGDNRAGLGYTTAQAIADAAINMEFVVA